MLVHPLTLPPSPPPLRTTPPPTLHSVRRSIYHSLAHSMHVGEDDLDLDSYINELSAEVEAAEEAAAGDAAAAEGGGKSQAEED